MNEAAARIAETVMRRPVKFHNGFQGKEKTNGQSARDGKMAVAYR